MLICAGTRAGAQEASIPNGRLSLLPEISPLQPAQELCEVFPYPRGPVLGTEGRLWRALRTHYRELPPSWSPPSQAVGCSPSPGPLFSQGWGQHGGCRPRQRKRTELPGFGILLSRGSVLAYRLACVGPAVEPGLGGVWIGQGLSRFVSPLVAGTAVPSPPAVAQKLPEPCPASRPGGPQEHFLPASCLTFPQASLRMVLFVRRCFIFSLIPGACLGKSPVTAPGGPHSALMTSRGTSGGQGRGWGPRLPDCPSGLLPGGEPCFHPLPLPLIS